MALFRIEDLDSEMCDNEDLRTVITNLKSEISFREIRDVRS